MRTHIVFVASYFEVSCLFYMMHHKYDTRYVLMGICYISKREREDLSDSVSFAVHLAVRQSVRQAEESCGQNHFPAV